MADATLPDSRPGSAAPKMTFGVPHGPLIAEDGDMGGSPVRFRRGPATVSPAEQPLGAG
ncbi:hypothetical protein GCM10010286_24110 [Streptomyces toxytricini]|nr:hypothetical protein GCM10010286_24110 [Streptomyces toxytricini]